MVLAKNLYFGILGDDSGEIQQNYYVMSGIESVHHFLLNMNIKLKHHL